MKNRNLMVLLVIALAGTICLLFVESARASQPDMQPTDPVVGLNGGVCAYDSLGEALAAASSGDVVYVSAGTYNERLGQINMDLTLTAASTDCTQAVDLPQYAVDIDANDQGAAFGGVIELMHTRTLTLTNLYLSDGSASFGGLLYVHPGATLVLDDTDLGYGTASQYGGGIRAKGSIIFRNGSTLFSSRVTGSGHGGGVSVVDGGQLVLREGSTIGFCGPGFENISPGDGGGVYLSGGALTLYDTSRICNNAASRNGGGVFATGGSVVELHDQSAIGGLDLQSGNTAQVGAGVYLTGTAYLSLTDASRIEFNTADQNGGGVAVQGQGEFQMGGTESVITDNVASDEGGGVWVTNQNPGDAPQAVFLAGAILETNTAAHGGGLFAEGLGASVRITDTMIRRNTGLQGGGGLEIYNSAVVSMRGARIEGNEATVASGGGFAVLAGPGGGGITAISNTLIISNSAGAHGGGIWVDSAALRMNNTIVHANSAAGQGGGLAAANGATVAGFVTMSIPSQFAESEMITSPCDPAGLPADTYCAEFRENQSGAAGGGISVVSDSTLDISHTAFIGNHAETVGSAVYSESPGDEIYLSNNLFRDNMGGNVVRVFFGRLEAQNNTIAGNSAPAISLGWANPPAILANNVIWDNADGVVSNGAVVNATCSISQNGVGGLLQDPNFVTAARGQYHLGLGSEALDVCANGTSADLDNVLRPVNTLWDMGAFERVEYIPVAQPDVYTATWETTLVIPAPGVMENDHDANGDPLTAALDTGPAHGTLSLQPDGSFTYRPDDAYLGPDQFTYTVTDGVDQVQAVVSINVVEAPRPVYLPAIFRRAG